MNVFHVMDEILEPIPDNPVPEAGKTIDPKEIADLEKKMLLQKEQEHLACGHIKNVLFDHLYDLYSPITYPRELWKALGKRIQGTRRRIYEETRIPEKRGKPPAIVHSVQAGGKGKERFKSAGPTKKWNLGPQEKSFKRQGQFSGQGNIKRNGKCHVCGETWHYARECKLRKSWTSETANAIAEIEDLVANLRLEEIDMLVVNGATVHVCDSRDKFVEYHEVHDGKQVTVANKDRDDIAGIKTVQHHFTSGNILTLMNVLHVPTIAKIRFVHVYLLHSKDEAFEAFKVYKAEVENQKEKRIKILRSDRGDEYFSSKFDTLCEENGIKHQCSSPFTPQQTAKLNVRTKLLSR
ncbi:hypothetical protein OSB04_006668 [Centaurea solstitialis]|uniref:Polyprotein n=1 Tax=Centaurea solstitialis TaxID=347529 RepID=A0AA38TIC7_9ASTR|nr:hypothetical protein OSB04_006668 [Centaurea solstitialis]